MPEPANFTETNDDFTMQGQWFWKVSEGVETTNMPIEVSQAQLPSIIMLFVLLVSVLIAIYFVLKSGDKYSVEDAQSDAVGFAGEVMEAEGPITTFLKIAYIVIIVWAVVYLALYL